MNSFSGGLAGLSLPLYIFCQGIVQEHCRRTPVVHGAFAALQRLARRWKRAIARKQATRAGLPATTTIWRRTRSHGCVGA